MIIGAFEFRRPCDSGNWQPVEKGQCLKRELTLAEQLLFSTIMIVTSKGKGTGFFLGYAIGDKRVPVLCTNRHVLNDNPDEQVSFQVHLDADSIEQMETVQIDLAGHWMFHPSEDLAVCFATPLIQGIEENFGRSLFYRTIGEDSIAKPDFLEELDALEEVTMVGYPLGLSDEAHSLPIFRKGYTASHPALDFNGTRRGLMDIAGLPGSSGSPVFIFNQSTYADRYGTINVGGSRLALMGVQVAIPIMNAMGTIDVVETPTQQQIISRTEIPTNLAYYIKAEELLWFKNMIEKVVLDEG